MIEDCTVWTSDKPPEDGFLICSHYLFCLCLNPNSQNYQGTCNLQGRVPMPAERREGN